MSQDDPASPVVRFNELIQQLPGKAEAEESSDFFANMKEIAEKHIHAIERDSFQWTKDIGTDLKEFFANFKDLKSPLFLELAGLKYFGEVFPIRFFRLLVSANIGRVGGSASYDESLRALSNLLSFFLNMYLRKALAFKPVLKSRSLHLYDPCFREKVRERNLADGEIQSFFFTPDFDLKGFVFQCVSKYFPNVSWRWLGGKQFAHYMTLKMILVLFEYGLWRMDELDMLLTKVYSVSEILCNLETYIDRDSRSASYHFTNFQMNEWQKVSTKCRKKIGSIFLHIIIMYLDKEVMAALPEFRVPLDGALAGQPRYVSAQPTPLENLFYVKRFKKKKLYTYFAYSLVTYLVRPVHFKGADDPVGSDSLDTIITILMGYVSEIENNLFTISLNTFQSEAVPFYLLSNDAPLVLFPNNYVEAFKGIISNLQTGGYGVVDFQNARFFGELADLFGQVGSYLRVNMTTLESFCAIQHSFLFAEVPHYILALLDFASDFGAREPLVSRAIKAGFDALVALCRENNQAINNVFSNYNYRHLTSLLGKTLLNGVFFIVKLFGKSSTLYILEKNDEMFGSLLKEYRTLLDSTRLLARSSTAEADELASSDLAENLVGLVIYNRLFRRILKNSQQKGFKFHLYIADILSSKVTGLLSLLLNKEARFCSRFEENKEAYKRVDNLLGMASVWFELDPSERLSLVFEAIYSTLSLAFESVRKVYTEKTLNSLAAFFKANELPAFLHLATSKYGLRMLKVVTQLFGAVCIFPQNHLLDRTSLLVQQHGVMVEEYLRKEQTDARLFEQLIAVSRTLRIRVAEDLNPVLQNYLLTGFLPIVFKLFSGLLTHFTEDRFKAFRRPEKIKFIEHTNTLLGFAEVARAAFERAHGARTVGPQTHVFLATLKSMNAEKSPMYFFQETLNPEIDSFRRAGYDLVDVLASIYLYDELKVPQVSEFVRYNYYNFEESTIDVMRQKLEFLLKFRHEFHGREEKKAVLWDRKRKYIEAFEEMREETNAQAQSLYSVIKNFDFDIPEEENMRFINSPGPGQSQGPEKALRASGLILQAPRTRGAQLQAEWLAGRKHSYISGALLYIKERYKFMKAYFLENTNSNQIFIVFRLEDVIKKNIQIFIEYFFSRLALMDLTFDELKNNFFINESFFSIFILMDNLIRTSPKYRAAFYEILRLQPDNNAIEKLWALHRMLLGYSLYSTFLDSSWQILFTHYYLISNFIQDFCEDNFYKFKRWFFHGSKFRDGEHSLLEAYYSFLEAAFKNTELPQYNREQLALADKPELFFVYDRLIEGMTEFINGGRTLGQEIVYQKRIDIWVGIVMRVIDNVDSTFYLLKYNVLLYLQAILECADPKVADFVASNFSVSRTFRLIVRLLKKLFIRQKLLKAANRHRVSARGRDIISVIGADLEASATLDSVDGPMDFYKKYDETFSDHVIMNTLVGLYTFVRQMAQVVVRYKNFLDEINAAERNMFVRKRRFNNEAYDTESIVIWHFLKSIIGEMEILYVDNQAEVEADEDNPGKEAVALPLRKVTHHFKKLPVCYFLTENVRDNFRFYVNIDSIDLKHDEFFEKSKQFIFGMRNLRSLYKKSKFLFYISTEEAFRYCMIFLYLLGVTINILFLVLFRDDDKAFFGWEQLKKHKSVTGLALIDAGLAFLLLVLWFLCKHPTIKRIKWEQYFLVNPRRKPDLRTIVKVSFWRSTLKKKQFRTFFFHILFSLLGVFVSPFFYSFLLLMIVDLSFLVYSVIISFVKNYDKLAYTLLMIIVVINFFAFIASDFYQVDFGNDPALANFCLTYFTCLINSLNWGLRNGGGLAGNLPLVGDNHAPKFEGRFFFDVMFFILINIILLGMFFGIIVDSFKEYRDKMEDRSYDINNVCFTCGAEKDKLEKGGEDFSAHVQRHDIWNYLFYIIYLEWKPFNAYDGVDLYVNERIENNKRREWMPIDRALEEHNSRVEDAKREVARLRKSLAASQV